ncbi:unnamed protein product [Brassica napus]|uniref:(rape) hypothetical protein n=1 Tax=Brassica napus TaxID=3708 RepID=A0A816T2J2_BRANA|nr:unnamed protein product [Brassica napus]
MYIKEKETENVKRRRKRLKSCTRNINKTSWSRSYALNRSERAT